MNDTSSKRGVWEIAACRASRPHHADGHRARGLFGPAAIIALTLALSPWPPLCHAHETPPSQSRDTASKIVSFGEGIVSRTSDREDEHGRHLPPWTRVEVVNVFGFKREPRVGERVTVVPLRVGIPPISLEIVGTQGRSDDCRPDASPYDGWEVKLAPVTDSAFFEVSAPTGISQEYPFQVAVVYPAVKNAQAIEGAQLRESMLPPKVALRTVKAAIDVDADGKPDFLQQEFCCKQPDQPAGGCDLTCGKTFRKTGASWRLIGESTPC